MYIVLPQPSTGGSMCWRRAVLVRRRGCCEPLAQTSRGYPSATSQGCQPPPWPALHTVAPRLTAISPEENWNVCVWGATVSAMRKRACSWTRTAWCDPADDAHARIRFPSTNHTSEEVMLRVTYSTKCNWCQCNENYIKILINAYLD
jgi:hypothetical protein